MDTDTGMDQETQQHPHVRIRQTQKQTRTWMLISKFWRSITSLSRSATRRPMLSALCLWQTKESASTASPMFVRLKVYFF